MEFKMIGWHSHEDSITYRAIVMPFSGDPSIDRMVPIVEYASKRQIQHDITCTDVTVQDACFVVGHFDNFSHRNELNDFKDMAQPRTD